MLCTRRLRDQLITPSMVVISSRWGNFDQACPVQSEVKFHLHGPKSFHSKGHVWLWSEATGEFTISPDYWQRLLICICFFVFFRNHTWRVLHLADRQVTLSSTEVKLNGNVALCLWLTGTRNPVKSNPLSCIWNVVTTSGQPEILESKKSEKWKLIYAGNSSIVCCHRNEVRVTFYNMGSAIMEINKLISLSAVGFRKK